LSERWRDIHTNKAKKNKKKGKSLKKKKKVHRYLPTDVYPPEVEMSSITTWLHG